MQLLLPFQCVVERGGGELKTCNYYVFKLSAIWGTFWEYNVQRRRKQTADNVKY